MAIHYLFSGFDEDIGFPERLAGCLKRDIVKTNLLICIATSPNLPETTDKYIIGIKQLFIKIGIDFKEVKVVDYRINATESNKLIESASCIVLMGGNPVSQINFLKEFNLVDSLKKYNGIVCGISAGAINVGTVSLCTKDKDFQETVTYEGLGLVDLTIDPHFSPDRQEYIQQEILPLSNQFTIYGLSDDAAIRVEGRSTQFFGDIFKIKNKSIEKIRSTID